MLGKKWGRGISHVILDEVHERDLNNDLLLTFLKDRPTVAWSLQR